MPWVKLRAGDYKIPVNITAEKGRIFLQFGYNKTLLDEVKNMAGRRWHGYDDKNPRKVWSVTDCARNRFQLAFLAGKDPYFIYDSELLEVQPRRDILMPHQLMMFRHQVTRKQAIISGEMGVGKTLAMIEALEYFNFPRIVWVSTGSAVAAVKLEFRKWQSPIRNNVLFLTYHSFRDLVKNDNLPVAPALVFDEAQKLKSHQTAVSQMADSFTEAMRQEYGEDTFISLMSGAPAPNIPPDWWHLCEVACPGFIKEGDWWKFRDRLSVISQQTSASNQQYSKVETWLDDENKCAVCGKYPQEHGNDLTADHDYRKSVNEIELLYKRMNGLNIVYFKQDVLKHLPELQFRKIKLKATDLIKNAERMIISTTGRAITAMLKLRELSDGFQYKDIPTGEYETCECCKGRKTVIEYYDPEYPEEALSEEALQDNNLEKRTVTCYVCEGSGTIEKVKREAVKIACPKDQLTIDLLEEHEDCGRFVIYAGFQASVDRCIDIAIDRKWDVIRADGRGWCYLTGQASQDINVDNYKALQITGMSKEDMLERFQNKQFPNPIVFIGQAGAAGTGLTLTASPSIFFYSNSFNGDDRIQAINRIHRPGMDVNKGATIIDCVHLDSDQYVLDSLDKKLNLLAMSMGKFRKTIKEYGNGRTDDCIFADE